MPARVVRQLASDDEVRAFEGAAGGGTRQLATPEEAAAFDATGEPGQPGHDPYAGGANARVPTEPVMPMGTAGDALRSFADKAALGAGPQIAGAMGAVANAATQGLQDKPTSDLDAYRDVRDDTARDLKVSENTTLGQAVTPLAAIATPVPVKALPRGASIPAKALRAAEVGGGVGFAGGLINSDVDLTRPTPEGIKRALGQAFVSGGLGAGGGYVGGAMLGAAEPKLRSFAEEQALRAAGLQSGIKNSLKTDLGLNDMTEARALGRRFLDEGLIPPVGSSEAVAKRAAGLEGRAGQTIGATMNKADVATMHTPPPPPGQTSTGRPSNVKPRPGFDYNAGADNAHRMLDDASSVADDMSGSKARDLAEAFRRQAQRTPGSFVGANKAKSDAWKSARFDADAPMSAQLYRKAVGAIRDDIERQVGDALGPDDAAALRSANEKFGVAADAQKLAANESQRRASRKGVTMGDVLALTTGGTAGGFAGHPGLGVGGGLAASLGLKAADKFGHSSASRFSDFLAKRAAANTGGATAGALAPYLELLEEEKKP